MLSVSLQTLIKTVQKAAANADLECAIASVISLLGRQFFVANFQNDLCECKPVRKQSIMF